MRLRNKEVTVSSIQNLQNFFPFPAFSQETNKLTTEFKKKDILINKIEKQRSNSIQNSKFATFFFLCPAFSQETNKPTAEFKKNKKINLDR